MSKANQDKIERLRRKIADTEASLAGLRDQLARLEEGVTIAQAAAEDPVLALWKAALGKARERSSKQQCRVMWNRIPKAERPDQETALIALRAWNRCEQWTKDACAYAPGLHRWIERRGWEDLPQVTDPIARYRKPDQEAPATAPEELATQDDIRSILGGFKPRCTPPATPEQSTGNPGQKSHLSVTSPDGGPEVPICPTGTLSL